MFRGVRQCGFIPVLQSFGSSPLELWDMKVENGCVRRVTDEEVRALALEIASTNVSTCYLRCPRRTRDSLGIHMPYLVMILKNMKKYFTFEVTILDDTHVHRRFRMSNFQRMTRIQHFSTSLPLCLNPGWNEIYFDLSDITHKAYKTNYVETTHIQIHANCRIRVIYFCDKIYEDKDIPQKFKMFLPTDHLCQRKSADSIPAKEGTESAPESILEAEFHLSEGEDEESEIYLEESLKSLEEAMSEGKPGSIEEKRSTAIATLEDVDEEGEEEEEEDEDRFGAEIEDEVAKVEQELPGAADAPETSKEGEAENVENDDAEQDEHDALEE